MPMISANVRFVVMELLPWSIEYKLNEELDK